LTKKYFLTIFKYFISIIVLILLYNISLYCICLFDSKLIYNNVYRSAETLKNTTMYYLPLFKAQIDNSADGLIINEMISIDNEHPLESYMKVRKNYNSEYTTYQLKDQTSDLFTYSQNIIKDGKPIPDGKYRIPEELLNFLSGKVNISVDYARYYHGYLLIYRPLLLLFDITGIRTFNFIMFLLLFAILTFELNKKFDRRIAFSICFSLIIFELLFISYSLHISPMTYVLLISSIILVKKIENMDFNKLAFFLFIVGSITSFFDTLTVPVLTLTIPLLIFTLYYSKNNTIKNKDLFFQIVKVCFTWGLGFAITWISKWIICDLVLHTDIISTSIEQVIYRTVGAPRDISTSLLYLANKLGNYTILLILFVLFYDTFMKHFCKNKKSNYLHIDNLSQILLICLIPVAWCLVTSNHVLNHIFFTFRNFVMIYMFILFLFFRKQKN